MVHSQVGPKDYYMISWFSSIKVSQSLSLSLINGRILFKERNKFIYLFFNNRKEQVYI